MGNIDTSIFDQFTESLPVIEKYHKEYLSLTEDEYVEFANSIAKKLKNEEDPTLRETMFYVFDAARATQLVMLEKFKTMARIISKEGEPPITKH